MRDDDPKDEPVGVLREWDASGGTGVYAETYTRDGAWEHSNVRQDAERASDIFTRIVPSDAARVGQFIASLRTR